MKKALLFDLDGVLVDSKELHYAALNRALELFSASYVISPEEQLAKYEGKTTRTKLEILAADKGLPKELFEDVWQAKQSITAELFSSVSYDKELVNILALAKSRGFFVAVVSNSIRQTLDGCIEALGLTEFVDVSISNEDVLRPKPSPEPYLLAMRLLGVLPKDCAILEDSEIGKTAALASGAKLVPIQNRKDLTTQMMEKVMSDVINGDERLNILIPMAGAGTRFAEQGYEDPKPAIDVNGSMMIEQVVRSLGLSGHYIFLMQREHDLKYNLASSLKALVPDSEEVHIWGRTAGAASTTLLAKELIDNDTPLLIVNSDQLVEWDAKAFLSEAKERDLDGHIAVFKDTHEKWSYARVSSDTNLVTEVAEKQAISSNATVGIYYWKSGAEYVKYAEQMIEKDLKVNEEFYICPVYNEALQDGKKVGVYHVDKMISLGTPEDLKKYLSLEQS